jgi:hypothetical protein
LEVSLENYCKNPRFNIVKLTVSGLQQSFEECFGSQFNIKFIMTSVSFSLVTVVTVTLLWSIIRPDQFANFLKGGLASSIGAIVLAALFLNLIPDVLSLWQTSKIVKILSNYLLKAKNQYQVAAAVCCGLLIDIVVTLCIGVLVLYLYSTINSFTLLELAEKAIKLEAITPGSFSVGIFFYTTFATTLWITLWAFASTLQLSENVWSNLISFLTKLIDVSKDPFTPVFWSIKILIAFVLVIAVYVNGTIWVDGFINFVKSVTE